VTVYAAIPNTPTLANWLGQMGSYVVNFRNGSEASATELDCIENGALERFLTAWSDLYVTGALSNTAGSTDAFVAGQQLIMTSSSSSIHSVRAKVDGAFEVGIAVYPKVDENASLGASVNGSCLAMFDHGDAARRKAAWLFAQSMAGADVQADFAANTGYLPSSAAADREEVIAGNPEFAVGLRQLLETPASMRSVTVGPSADFYYAIMNDISDMLEDDFSIEETVEMLSDDLGGMLEQYARANG
jgi:sn-glycerol 3-phosphate transport system substrate-binding protein